jgi:Protein of unknown function (DUF2877)
MSSLLDFSNPFVREAWRTAWLLLRGRAASEGLGAMLCHPAWYSPLTAAVSTRARVALPQLMHSVRQREVAPALAAGLPLIGAGPGLTPSWDDLLIGFCCGLRASCGSDASQSCFIAQFSSALARAAEITTAVSRCYIRRTVEGAGPPWIEEALAAIAAGDSSRTYGAAARALRVGHTSGTDMMLGAILGSSVWQSGKEVHQVLHALSCRPLEFPVTPDPIGDHRSFPNSPCLSDLR